MTPTAASIHDKKTMTAFARSLITKKCDPKIPVIISCILGAIVIILVAAALVMMLFADLHDHDIERMPSRAFIPLAAIVGITYPVMLLTRYFAVPKTTYEGQGALRDIKNTYTFLPDRMICTSALPGFTSQDTISYGMIQTVKETSEYFFAFRSSQSAYIIDKAQLFYCNADFLRQLLTSGGAQYILCSY